MDRHLNTTPTGSSLLLPIEWQAEGQAEETAVSIEAWLEALLEYPEPVSLAFVLCASRTVGVRGGLVVNAIDVESARNAALLIRDSAEAVNAWQGLGDPEPYQAPAPGPDLYDLAEAEGPGRAIWSSISAPWTLAIQQEQLTAMTIELRGRDTGADPHAVRCTVSLSGHGPAATMIAALLVADTAGPVRLQATPRSRPASQPPELSLPLPMAAHLISTPARIQDGWPTRPIELPRQLTKLVERATPPHSALFGGSGQGKTTLMEHLVHSSLDANNTVVVMCSHGDLANRAAAAFTERRGGFFGAVDFGDQEHCPTWNLCAPPPGSTPTQWAAELVGVARAAWQGVPADCFGPAWAKNMQVALSVLMRDPLGPHPLTDITDVMKPPLQPRWSQALDRIGDSRLSAGLRELHESIAKDREDAFGLWVTSELEPFIADDRIRRVISDRQGSVNLSRVVGGESLVISVPAWALGDEGASLVIGTLLTHLWRRIRRQPRPSGAIDLFVDEAHRIPPHALKELLTEGRKFGLRLRLATQSPNQLDRGTRDTVLNNAGALATFRTGPQEASYLAPMFPATPPGVLNRLKRHWVAFTDGERDVVCPTEPPVADPDDRRDLAAASRAYRYREKFRDGQPPEIMPREFLERIKSDPDWPWRLE